MSRRQRREEEANEEKLYLKRAMLWRNASWLLEHGFTVHLTSSGSMRARCMGCGKVYEERFKFAEDHVREGKCPLQAEPKVEAAVGEVVASVALPKAGQRFTITYETSKGPVRVTAVVNGVSKPKDSDPDADGLPRKA